MPDHPGGNRAEILDDQKKLVVSLKNVEKSYKKFSLKLPDLFVHKGEFLSVIGPSGSGKSTLLKLIGGFIIPDRGEVLINGTPAHFYVGARRTVRTLFQDLALFPHLSVYKQLYLACVLSSKNHYDKRKHTEQWIERLRLEERRDHKPGQLSGGERQRLALGRAMISDPDIILLDEPMTALDHGLRSDLWEYIDKLAAETSTAFVVVTHDPDIALSRSDRIVVIEGGECVQVGSPTDLYRRPASQNVARLLGSANVINVNGRKLVIRPEQIKIGSAPIPDKDFTDQALLLHSSFLGSMIEYTLSWNKERLLVRGSADEDEILPPKREVYFGWDREDAILLN